MASRDTLFTPWLKYLIRVRAQGTLEGGGCQSETIVYLLFHGYVYICGCIPVSCSQGS